MWDTAIKGNTPAVFRTKARTLELVFT